ncbi:MAG TPA: hypothetical protein VER17_05075 [Tepidisphaeraceae bacterium]|nr:hypothetical protein [Tepidisphaeraceae bacterium]
MRRSLRGILALCATLMMAAAVAAQAAPASQPASQPATAPSQLQLSTDRLVVFKDGHGLVMQTGRGVADDQGRAFITDIPDSATLGCFWAIAEDGAILAMRAEWVETRDVRRHETPCLSIAELIRANVGKTLTLEMTDKGPGGAAITQEGRLVELLELPPEDVTPAPALAAGSPSTAGLQPALYSSIAYRSGAVAAGSFSRDALPGGGMLSRDLVPRGGELLVLALDDNRRLVLPVAQVKSMRGGADVVTTTRRQQEVYTRAKRLSFDFGKSAAGKAVSLRLFFFTPGLRWIPTYRISGELKDSAAVALQGEILNDVADAEHAALDLVVGVPHFRFADIASPLTLERTLRAAMSAANVNVGNNFMMNSQFAMDNRARADTGVEQPVTVAPELLGSGGEQDLFVYHIKDFSLKKGARATVPLWQQTAPLRHLYTFNINAKRSQGDGRLVDDAAPGAGGGGGGGGHGHPAGRSPNRIVLNQVWHQLELTNAGDVPWTTGAALLLRDLLPLGQDLLVYTPPRGKVLVPVTVAVDLRGSIDEQEISRQDNALRFDGSDYSRVTKRGTITLNSFRRERSTMRINLGIGGKVLSASDEGKVTLNDLEPDDWANGSVRINNHSDVTWELDVEPGVTKTITYEVSFYTR